MKRIEPSTVLVLVGTALTLGCNGARNHGMIHASGHIEATEIRLATKIAGRLLEAPFQEGDQVRAGDVVARIETVDLEHRLAQARAEVDAADAQLRLLLSGTRAEDLRQAEEQLAQARAELDAATRDRQRLEGLADRGSASIKARDDARTRVEVAERAVAAGRSLLDKLVAGPRREEIETARARRAAAAAGVAGWEQQIRDGVVAAPRDGVITTRVAEPGEILAPGTPVAVMTVLDEPWLVVWVDEPHLASVHLGDSVEVRVDGDARSFEGRATFIASTAEFTPKNVQTPEERAKLVFRVKIALANPDGIFKPGMPADAYFAPARAAASAQS
jgi:HlyD family secretion protein